MLISSSFRLQSEDFMPRKKEITLVETTIDYKNAMAKEKLRRLQLQNEHQAFDLEKKQESICYRAVAMSEFEKAVGSIYAQIKNADEQLTALLHLNQQQTDILHNYMENILEDLSNIEINLSTTTDFDADNYFAGKARRSQLLDTNN
jgi:hypothetical protein